MLHTSHGYDSCKGIYYNTAIKKKETILQGEFSVYLKNQKIKISSSF
jgi:hypothetical protein